MAKASAKSRASRYEINHSRDWIVTVPGSIARGRTRSRSQGPKPSSHTIFDIDPSQAEIFLVDNSSLRATTEGLAYRRTKDVKDRIYRGMTLINWGEPIRGIDEGDGWIRAHHGFLPKFVEGHEVLVQCKKGKGEETKNSAQKVKECGGSQQDATISDDAVPQVAPSPSHSDQPKPSARCDSPETRCSVSDFQAPQQMGVTSIFNLMIMIGGGPGPTVVKLLEVVEDTFNVLSVMQSQDALEERNANLSIISQCTCMVAFLMDKIARTTALADVIKKLLLCLVQGNSQLPTCIRTVVMDPLVEIVRKPSFVLEAANQIWVILRETPFHEQIERIYAVGLLAAHFEQILIELLKRSTSNDQVQRQKQRQMSKMCDRMHSVALNARFHVDHLKKHEQLYDGALPNCAKQAMEVSAVRQKERRRWCMRTCRSLTVFPKDRRLDPAFDNRPITLTQYLQAHEDEGFNKVQLTEKWRDLDKEVDESEDSEDVDSESSPEADRVEDGEDLMDFIDCSAEFNSYGIIDPSELPQTSDKFFGPSSSSPMGLLAFLKKAKTSGGTNFKDEELKKVEALLKSNPVEGWYDALMHIMESRLRPDKPSSSSQPK